MVIECPIWVNAYRTSMVDSDDKVVRVQELVEALKDFPILVLESVMETKAGRRAVVRAARLCGD